MSGPVLSLRDVSVAHGGTQVLHGVSLAVGPGECVGLVGESGCGKSTLALAVMRALPPGGRVTGGVTRIGGQDVAALGEPALRRLRATTLSMVYQDAGRALNPTLTIGRQVIEAFAVLGAGRRDAQARAHAALAQVRIAEPGRVMLAYPHQLSGGMQQRVMIAMALAKDPALLILDEPTTGLDATVQAAVLDLVAALRARSRTAILLISHNIAVVARLCDRIAVLYAGRLIEEGPAAAVLRRPRHPYTDALLRCLPDGTRRKQDGALPSIQGELPPPGATPPGCVFAPRCLAVQPVCRVTAPLWAGASGHRALCHAGPAIPAAAAGQGAVDRPAVAGGTVLRARGLSKTYTAGGATICAVRDVSFSLAAGETLGLVGESGSGKTTLARMLLGLTTPDPGGCVSLDGTGLAPALAGRPRAARKAVQIVFQNPDGALNPAHRVRQILARPLRGLAGVARAELAGRVAGLARSVRLDTAHLAMRPGRLSGGLKQRVAIARAFAGGPRVVICDEPCSALDASVQAAILNLFAALQRQGQVSLLFISHDLGVVRYIADRVAVMYAGMLVEIGPAEAVFGGPNHPYTAALLAAVSPSRGGGGSGGGGGGAPIRLADETARGAAMRSGCVFHPRCPRKLGPVCETVAPAFDSASVHGIRCHIPVAELG
jgi:peptide/nickel transport system ATP-binding protein